MTRKPGADAQIRTRPKAIVFLATLGPIGYSPLAPGTAGSLAALPLCGLISLMRFGLALTVVVVLVGLAVWIAHAAEKAIARNDPPEVVIDEVCGMMVALLGLPFTPGWVIGGFALFRLFDIVKPFPIRWVDRRVPGGWGIMLDDIIAGVLANGVLRLGIVFFS